MKNYITRRTSNFFDDPFETFFRPFYVSEEAGVMKTDIKENENNYELEVEMAGFDKKDIALNYENGYLTVSAKKQASAEKDKYLRRERSFSCSRSYYLGDVNEKLIKARYENGVLTVVVPKQKPEELSHSITID